jgi:DDE family transposase
VIGKPVCDACPLRQRCVTAKVPTREILRWVHEDVIERHRARMQSGAALMRRRASLAEHPFGTLKRRAGYRHFLVRGLDKVRGEWSLMALCYNFTRVLNVLGFDRFIAEIARITARAPSLLNAPITVLLCIRTPLTSVWRKLAKKNWPNYRLRPQPAT